MTTGVTRYLIDRRPHGLGAVALMVSIWACGPDPNPREDTAGVMGSGSAWSGGAPWVIDTVPIYRVDGNDPEYPLTQVVAARFVHDDLLVIGDRPRSPSVSAFDGTGERLWWRSEVGDGPGELNFLALAWLEADSTVTLYDPSTSRLVRLDPATGALADQVTFGDWLSAGGPAGTVIRGPAGPTSFIGWPNSSIGTIRDGVSYTPAYTIDLSDRSMTEFAEIGRLGVVSEASPRPPILGQRVIVYAGGGRLLHGLGEDFTITEWTFDDPGGPRSSADFGRPYDRRAVSERMIEGRKQADLARPTSDPPEVWAAEIERRYAEGPIADFLPAFDRILIDDLDHVWVRHFLAPGDTMTHWSVFDVERTWLGDITLPTPIDVVDVGVERIAAIVTDDFDVPSVVVLRLDRG